MTAAELELAKRAASRFLAPAIDKLKRKSAKLPGFNLAELQALFVAANDAYEARKNSGATLAGIEREFGMNPHSLKSWRSRRMIDGDKKIKRIYVNRPLKARV